MIQDVLLIDDRRPFAVHVWRFLDRAIGLGYEEYLEAETPMTTDDGRFRFWWIEARDSTQESLGKILLKARNLAAVLIDVHGDRRSGYDCKVILNYLLKQGSFCASNSDPAVARDPGDRIFVVSAYFSFEKVAGRPVLPKSRNTFRLVGDLLGISNPYHPSTSRPRVVNILLTGAGFEMSSRPGSKGGPQKGVSLGLPPTSIILDQMGPPFLSPQEGARFTAVEMMSKILLERSKDSTSFPIPKNGKWLGDSPRQIQKLAQNQDLDGYWDFLLQEEQTQRLNSNFASYEASQRDTTKSEVLQRESALREAFRKSLVKYDWGFMRQSVQAAIADWDVWLTTNYTHFSNRSIDLAEGRSSRSWRLVSTSAEANDLRRELAARSAIYQSRYTEKFLFKLHGDVGHLHTMAIAGHDKETFSPLSMPVSVYEIYQVAGQLLGTFKDAEKSHYIWHIVGHGLYDRRLIELIRNTLERTIGAKAEHTFLIANPSSEPKEKLSKALAHLDRKYFSILARKFKASEYMARIADRAISQKLDVKTWFQNLPDGREERRS